MTEFCCVTVDCQPILLKACCGVSDMSSRLCRVARDLGKPAPMSRESHQPTLGVTLVHSKGFFRPTSSVYMLRCNTIGWMSTKGDQKWCIGQPRVDLSVCVLDEENALPLLQVIRLGPRSQVGSHPQVCCLHKGRECEVVARSFRQHRYLHCPVRCQVLAPTALHSYVKRSITNGLCIGKAETAYANRPFRRGAL